MLATDPGLSPRTLAQLVLDALEMSDLTEDQVAAVDGLVRVVMREGTREAWRTAAAALWDDPDVFLRLDAVSGLRAHVRRAIFATVFEAMTASLVRSIQGKRTATPFFGIADGLLWLPDTAVRYLILDLELGDNGTSSFWEEDPEVSDMVGQDEGAHGLWERYLRWAAQGEELRRGWTATPEFLGCYPATGLLASLPRLAPLRSALRVQRRAGAFIATPVPALLPWTPAISPSLETLVGTARGLMSSDPQYRPWSVVAHHAAKREDPQRALLYLLARSPLPSAAAALVDVVRRHLLHLVPLGRRCDRVWSIHIPHRFMYPPLALARRGERLLCSVDGLAGLLTWLGLVPEAYRPVPPFQKSWGFPTLRACGWQLLERTQRWTRVQGFRTGVGAAGAAEAIAFPPGEIPKEIPEWPEPLAIAHDAPTAQLEMDFHARW